MSAGEIATPLPCPVDETVRPSLVRWGWIVGPGVDLPWFIGGALAGYALFTFHAWLAFDMMLVWMLWFTLSNLPHFFGTYVRLYLDREERRRRTALAWGSFGILAVGPLALLGCWFLYRSGGVLADWSRLPFDLLAVFVGLWAYWHMVRQHYGFLALYRRKNQDNAAIDRRLDNLLLYVCLLGTLIAFLVRHPDTRERLGLPREMPSEGWETVLIWGIRLSLLGSVLVFIGRQIQRYRRQESLNVPKLLFFLAVIPLYTLIGHHPATVTAPVVAFAAFVTVFHDVQYHAIVYFHQRNRCYRVGDNPQRFGLAAVVTRSIWLYMACAIGMGVIAWMVSCRLAVYPGCTPIVQTHEIFLFGELTLRDLLLGFAFGFSMHHYFVDQFIWRPSKSAELRRDLRLTPDGM